MEVKRSFKVSAADNPTVIHVFELADGGAVVRLVTETEADEPVVSTVGLKPSTLGLLISALQLVGEPAASLIRSGGGD